MKRWITISLLALVALLGPVSNLTASPVGGWIFYENRVEANSSMFYRDIEVRGGEWTTVMLIGDGDTDIDVFATDKAGNALGSDTDTSDLCKVRFYSEFTQIITIEVRNLGHVYNAYAMGIH